MRIWTRPDPPGQAFDGPGLATTHPFGRRVTAVLTLAKNRSTCRARNIG
jgi:hypothetical protein